ncbi:hypothetical protein F5148DRAFT_1182740 [Russula earlei]|uniref:Uncharacterized protein n=1 Tax=Russula earlei TaxID=71964 RepID=A0ACC0UFJ6_9AGAM|nr:hypothetical protein F5148DRAFT_1182740 [Russula earlei]
MAFPAGDSKFLPAEIVEVIVQEVLGRSQPRAFSSIAALSLVSRQVRHIALRAYFSKLSVHRLIRASRINDIRNICSWVRHLSTTIQIVEKNVFPLYKMNLGSLELDCESVPAFSLAASILLVFPHFPETLVSLKLTSLPRITHLLLEEIARRCLNLRELELSVVQRLSTDCCWACFEDLSCCIEHSPVGSDPSSNTVGKLAMLYAGYLQSLVKLQCLSMGVFLSSPTILKDHIDNHSLVREDNQFIGCTSDDSFSAPHTPTIDGQEGRPRVRLYRKSAGGDIAIPEKGAVIGCRPYTPSECALCWEAHGLRTREDELMAAMRLAQDLRSLELVRWSSWFNSKIAPGWLDPSPMNDRVVKDRSGVADLRHGQWATFEIQRGERRIKVWRRT